MKPAIVAAWFGVVVMVGLATLSILAERGPIACLDVAGAVYFCGLAIHLRRRS